MLDKIKILIGLADDDSKDDLLLTLVGLAKEEAVEYCHLSEYHGKLDSAIIGMVVENYNKLGTEGVSSVSTNGVKEEYRRDYSPSIIRKLNKARKPRFL